ncbi:hypothetical protein JD292_03830 [Leucobacter sp. CSA2]|uniref:Uncharacterized protein n=1 Tax=Leucobacter edaphi TaxID=2796472 RepID=A0A934QDF2_9MICO|nr:hypothetical protein [Leucobacter edaphi]MBK0421212.1 hypothetical protein [Leucobacter edaphi]
MTAPQNRSDDELALARAMFPETAALLDRALERNGGADPLSALDAVLDEAAGALPRVGFSAAAAPAAPGQSADAPTGPAASRSGGAGDRAGETRGEPGASRASGPADADVEGRAIATIARMRRLFEPLGLPVPEPEAFVAAGVDPAVLAAAVAADPTLEIVAAPHGIGAEAWDAAFRSVQGPELVFASEVRDGFAQLDRLPGGVPSVGVPLAFGRRIEWSLRAIPADSRPAVLGLSHAHGPHPTVAEMLALQLGRFAEAGALVDPGTFTWLDGHIGGGKLAARHVYDAGEHAIRLSAREVGSQGPHMGARPPAGS